MSARRGSQILRDGLILCVDAGSEKSYPGSGTTFFDLSGEQNHLTIAGSRFQLLHLQWRSGVKQVTQARQGLLLVIRIAAIIMKLYYLRHPALRCMGLVVI